MFTPHRCYTHNRMLDAAIYVLKSTKLKDGRYSVRVKWVDRKGRSFGIEERIKIKKEEVRNWYWLDL